MVLELILGSSIVIALLSIVGIFALSLKEKLLKRIVLGLVALSAGALMGGAFLHLLPEAAAEIEGVMAYALVLVGFALFYILERYLYWHHCHKNHCPKHVFRYLNLVGDGIHNFVDGLIIAVSFIASVPLGIATALAVAAHEIPQEIGDFGVLVYGGFTKYKALVYNFIAALMIVPGAIVGYLLSGAVMEYAVFILPIAAGGFIYIAATDLTPELQKVRDIKKSLAIFLIFLIGIGFMWGLKVFFS